MHLNRNGCGCGCGTLRVGCIHRKSIVAGFVCLNRPSSIGADAKGINPFISLHIFDAIIISVLRRGCESEVGSNKDFGSRSGQSHCWRIHQSIRIRAIDHKFCLGQIATSGTMVGNRESPVSTGRFSPVAHGHECPVFKFIGIKCNLCVFGIPSTVSIYVSVEFTLIITSVLIFINEGLGIFADAIEVPINKSLRIPICIVASYPIIMRFAKNA